MQYALLILFGILAVVFTFLFFRAAIKLVAEPQRRNHYTGKCAAFFSGLMLMLAGALDPFIHFPDLVLAAGMILFWAGAGFGILFSLLGDPAEASEVPVNSPGLPTAVALRTSPAAAVITSLILVVVSPFVVTQGIVFHKPANSTVSAPVVSKLQAKEYVFDEFNMKFTAPAAPWIEMNMKQWNADTLVGFMRAKPNIYLQVIAEQNIQVKKGEERIFAEQVYAFLASKAQDHRLISTTPHNYAGVEGFLFYSEMKADGHKIYRLHWMGGSGGFYYQVVLFTPEASTEKEMKPIMEEVLKGFSLIDAGKEARPEPVKEDYESKRYSYKVKAKDSGWSKWWLPPMDDRVLDWADFKMSNGNNAALLVFPVFFYAPLPPTDVLTAALLQLNTIEVEKVPLEAIKSSKENGYDVRTIHHEQKVEGDLYHYAIKILAGNSRAFFATAYQSSKLQKEHDPQLLTKAISLFETTAPNTVPKRTELNETEKQLHSKIYTYIGDEYFRRHMTREGLDYYEDALKFTPDDIELLKALVNNLISLEYYVDALEFLTKYGKNFPGDLDLLESAAICNSKLKYYAEARKNYEELFDKGKIGKKLIREYLVVMKELKEEAAGRQKTMQLFKSDSPEQMVWLAEVFKEQGAKKESIELLAGLYAKHPRNEDVRSSYMFALMSDSQYGEVVRVAEEYLGKYGIAADVLTAQGLALAALKRYAEAKTAFVNAKNLATELDYLEGFIRTMSAVEDQKAGRKDRVSQMTVESISRFENGDTRTEEHATLVNQWALDMRNYLWEKDEEDWKKDYAKYLTHFFPRLEFNSVKVTKLDDGDEDPLELDLVYVSRKNWQKAGDKLVAALPLTWEARYLLLEEGQQARIFSFDLIPPGEVTSTHTLEYPAASYKLSHTLPANDSRMFSCGSFESAVEEAPGKLIVTRRFQMKGGGYTEEESNKCREEFLELFHDLIPKVILEPVQ